MDFTNCTFSALFDDDLPLNIKNPTIWGLNLYYTPIAKVLIENYQIVWLNHLLVEIQLGVSSGFSPDSFIRTMEKFSIYY